MSTQQILEEYMAWNLMNRKEKRKFIHTFRGLTVHEKAEKIKWVADRNFHKRHWEADRIARVKKYTNNKGVEMNNIVFMASALNRYPETMNTMLDALKRHFVDVQILDTKNIWLRDWMPIQVGNHFVKFNYKGYGIDVNEAYTRYPWLDVPESVWKNALAGKEIINSDITLDGGNIIWTPDHSKAFLTEIIFTHNPKIVNSKLLYMLENLLQAQVILLPVEPEDTLGHTDGILCCIDNHTVLMNDCSTGDEAQILNAEVTRQRLVGAVFHVELMPWNYPETPDLDEAEFRKKYPDADDINPGYGYYINFLKVKDVILLPQMMDNDIMDKKAFETAQRHFPESEVVRVPCKDLSMEGGLTSCVTMEYDLSNNLK